MDKKNIADFSYDTDNVFGIKRVRKFLLDAILWNNDYSSEDKVILREASEVLKKHALFVNPQVKFYD